MSERQRPLVPQLFVAAGIVTAVGAAAFLFMQRDYYWLGVGERPLHHAHEWLRSSGRVGLTLGLVGTALMVLNLTYLVRKKLVGWERLGSLRSWMSFHVFTGLVGPLLIVIHSAFAPRSVHGSLALGAMLVVVATGLIGRYFFSRVPRSVEGRELEIEELRRQLAGHREALARLGVESTLLDEGSGRVLAERRRGGMLAAAATLVAGDRAYRRDYRRLRRAVMASPRLRGRARHILPVAAQLCRDRHFLVRYRELRFLMSSWRFLHRWLAIVMLSVALSHVVLAMRFGGLWIFGSGS